MFTTASNSNKQTHTALRTIYTVNGMVTVEATDADGESQSLWEVHRIITKSYSYVGLTESAAKSVRDTKAAMYKRTYRRWSTPTTPVNVIMLCDSIEANHGEGSMWSVDIQVNEDDVLYTSNPQGDLALLSWPVIGHNFDE